LLRAAAQVFSEQGYVNASSESISRCAGMSKATFYQHFENKEECILAVFDRATEVLQATIQAAVSAAPDSSTGRIHAATDAYLDVLAKFPDYIQTILVESLAAGQTVAARRDEIMHVFTVLLYAGNAAAADRGQTARYASMHDAYAVVGAIAELITRQVRLGVPEDVHERGPVIERLIFAVAAPAPSG
jgi:AcrR family transcriptional regulator